MSSLWKADYVPYNSIIKIVGVRSYWYGPIYYLDIEQTTQPSDPNLSGTNETRSLAKCLFSTHLVNLVKLSGGTVTITVVENITPQEVFELSQSAIDCLSRFKILP